MDKKLIKDVWLWSQLSFAFLYTLSILRIFIKIPILSNLPCFSLCLLLSISYIMTMSKKILTSEITSIVSETNFYCLIVLLSFPSKILLLPFYVSSIFNLVDFVVTNKRQYHKYFFYETCKNIIIKRDIFIFSVYLLDVVGIFVASVGMLFRISNVMTVIGYCGVIRQEYLRSEKMKIIISDFFKLLDSKVDKMPEIVKQWYVYSRDSKVKEIKTE
ncbi:hypothetical protein CWI36_1861p0010 [Hamiltosporidium magnivora]|uniref:Uncharacterized protein n=1 Tax=Hamiltosporidium magnivora TaxID=148818 RepID=A0A4Q9KXU3_9MICR|nr:hypothetical protein CWI36_1861p0010 [Hamiltosporidium magnivora]